MQITVTSPVQTIFLEVPKEQIQEKFCTHCNRIFRKNVNDSLHISNDSIHIEKESVHINQLRLAYTSKPQNEAEEQMLKMVQDMIKRNW